MAFNTDETLWVEMNRTKAILWQLDLGSGNFLLPLKPRAYGENQVSFTLSFASDSPFK